MNSVSNMIKVRTVFLSCNLTSSTSCGTLTRSCGRALYSSQAGGEAGSRRRRHHLSPYHSSSSSSFLATLPLLALPLGMFTMGKRGKLVGRSVGSKGGDGGREDMLGGADLPDRRRRRNESNDQRRRAEQRFTICPHVQGGTNILPTS